MSLAPILLFVYNRPESTKKCIDALNNADQISDSTLIIFSDNYKNIKDKGKVEKVRELIKKKTKAKETIIVLSEKNNGLYTQIKMGVEYAFNKYDKVIVIEDDIIVEKKALKFLNKNLEKYDKSKNVYQITAFQFPIKKFSSYSSVYLPNVSTWAWATWKSKWKTISNEELLLFDEKLKRNKFYRYYFNLFGGYSYSNIVSKEAKRELTSWGIRFLIHVFQNKGIVIYPGVSMIKNIGFNIEATNTKSDPGYFTDNDVHSVKSKAIKKSVFWNSVLLSNYLKSLKK